jgi:WD40-like Beta Propeller Repeat
MITHCAHRLLRVACAVALNAPGMAMAQSTPELFLPGVVSSGHDESHLAFAPSGHEIYFLRNTPDFQRWTVMVSRLTGSQWSTPEVASFSGMYSDADVFVTQDNRLFFISTRPWPGHSNDETDTDIWVTKRSGSDSGWGAPVPVAELNSSAAEWYPTLTRDGTIYFGSERAGGFGASDLWRAHWQGDHFSQPENLGAPINSSDDEIEGFIASDERYLIFAGRRRAPGARDYDIFISWNCASGWTTPTPLAHNVNSTSWDFAARVSPDGKLFTFTSNRRTIPLHLSQAADAKTLERMLSSSGNGLRDIYVMPTASLGIQPPRDCAEQPIRSTSASAP